MISAVSKLAPAPGQESAKRISESAGFSVPDGKTELLPAIAEHANLGMK
jgi:hypothetical protein